MTSTYLLMAMTLQRLRVPISPYSFITVLTGSLAGNQGFLVTIKVTNVSLSTVAVIYSGLFQ